MLGFSVLDDLILYTCLSVEVLGFSVLDDFILSHVFRSNMSYVVYH